MGNHASTVHIILVCQRLFGDNSFITSIISSWNFHDVCQSFLCNQTLNFRWIRQKMRNFPKDPHCKKPHFGNVMSIDPTLQRWAVFTMRVNG